jgi:hypothetical protein
MTTLTRHPASFRDDAGFVFVRDGRPYRFVGQRRASDFNAFIAPNGLADELVRAGLLLPFELIPPETMAPDAAFVVAPEPVPVVSYPYEWPFSALRDAALLTLEIEERASRRGFRLRDATPFNIQFVHGRPVLIDHTSFERADPDRPWVAYRQFCEQFLAPLALASLVDPRLGSMSATFINGVPLDLAVRLLPRRSLVSFGLFAHLHLHAWAQRKYEGRPTARRATGSVHQHAGIIASLRRTIESLSINGHHTRWANYTRTTSYTERAAAAKAALVERIVGDLPGTWVWDLGANDGVYSELIAALGRSVVAVDSDPIAVDRGYLRRRDSGDHRVLALVGDLMNPTPAIGWANEERSALFDRINAGVVVALALVHHLAIGSNVPLAMIAELLCRLAPIVVVEWVPKDDPMVQRLLAARDDIFDAYRLEMFLDAFRRWGTVTSVHPIEDSLRSIVVVRRHG